MTPITLLYYDDSGTQHTQDFNALRVKMDPIDDLEAFPEYPYQPVDGSRVEMSVGTRRHITVELGCLQDYSDRLFCGLFLRANRKTITYTHDGINEIAIAVVNEDEKR